MSLGDPAAELRALPASGSAFSHELFVWRAESAPALAARLRELLGGGLPPEAPGLAYRLWREAAGSRGPVSLAVVASSVTALTERLPAALRALEEGRLPWSDPSGMAAGRAPDGGPGKVAFLFPGQGSQSPGMLRELLEAVPEARAAFENAARALAGRFDPPLMEIVFPPPGAAGSEREQQTELTRTDRAQPALGAAAMAVFRALRLCGVRPDLTGGHSYGEYAALCAAAVIDEGELARLSEARGRSILDAARADLGTMAAVSEGPERISALLAGGPEVTLANLNGPRQTVLSGARAAIERACAHLEERGVGVRPIPVGCAFHSPLMAPARDRLALVLDQVRFQPPQIPVYANSTAAPHAAEGAAIAAVLKEHLVRPVRFGEEIEAMYRDGARLFVEAGPRNVLTGLVRQILGSRPHLAVACDLPGRPSLPSFLQALAQLFAAGAAVDLEGLFRSRGVAAPATAAVAARRAPTAAQAEALAMFQETMRQFLETQRAVMTGFLDGAASVVAAPRALAPRPAAPLPAVPAGPPPAPVRPALAAAPAPAGPGRPIVDILLDLASDRTGYPPEMLGLDANLEADLGIDSIKRVEIIAAFRRAVLPSMGEPPAAFMERVTAAKTLRQIVAEVARLQEGS